MRIHAPDSRTDSGSIDYRSPVDPHTALVIMTVPDPVQRNREAWKQLARHGHRLTRPARDGDFGTPLASVDGPGWLGGSVAGQSVLCLAAGGGRQGPLYAAAGARVTVVDFCDELLEHDRRVATQRGLSLQTICTSMTDLSALGDSTFDLVIHPVSTCYVADPGPVFREVARVCRPGGLYISQHKQPASLQASWQRSPAGWLVEHPCTNRSPLPPAFSDNLVREPGTAEFVHSWEALVGGICRSGFVIEDLIEPPHADPAADEGSFAERSCFLPPYVRIRARRTGNPAAALRSLWRPEADESPAPEKARSGQ